MLRIKSETAPLIPSRQRRTPQQICSASANRAADPQIESSSANQTAPRNIWSSSQNQIWNVASPVFLPLPVGNERSTCPHRFADWSLCVCNNSVRDDFNAVSALIPNRNSKAVLDFQQHGFRQVPTQFFYERETPINGHLVSHYEILEFLNSPPSCSSGNEPVYSQDDLDQWRRIDHTRKWVLGADENNPPPEPEPAEQRALDEYEAGIQPVLTEEQVLEDYQAGAKPDLTEKHASLKGKETVSAEVTDTSSTPSHDKETEAIRPSRKRRSRKRKNVVRSAPENVSSEGKEFVWPAPKNFPRRGKEFVWPAPENVSRKGKEVVRPAPEDVSRKGKEFVRPEPENVSGKSKEAVRRGYRKTSRKWKEVVQPSSEAPPVGAPGEAGPSKLNAAAKPFIPNSQTGSHMWCEIAVS